MKQRDEEFFKMITGEIKYPKEEIGYKSPYQDLTNKQLYAEFSKLRPDLEYEDCCQTMRILEEMGLRFLTQLEKKYKKK